MKASTPIVPSLGLNAVRLSLLSGAVTAALGAPAMAQESMEIELDIPSSFRVRTRATFL